MNASVQDVYLDSYLAPLSPFLARHDITDIFINRPGELWIESLGGQVERFETPALTEQVLMRMARQVAAMSAQGISREHPLLAASLPDGSRIQIVLPPATRGAIAMAVRKHVSAGLSLKDYEEDGAFSAAEITARPRTRNGSSKLMQASELGHSLAEAVKRRQNILISGGTSSGKTTFLNALLQEIPPNERLVLIEDTPELRMTHANAVGLLASRSAIGEADITAEDLLIASLRMRPDRIILGEIRGPEALTYLRAINTGHPGSLTTIHADSPEGAIDQLAILVLQTGTRLAWDDVTNYVRRSVDMIVQLGRENGKRRIEQVMLVSK